MPSSTPGREGMGDVSLILIPLGFLVTLIFIILKASSVQKNVQDTITPFNCSQKVPCRNCRFFNQNFYLKCAVHPTMVLTEEAKQCSDFDPVALVKK
ncbi:MAG: hypothetical protein SFW36_06275 [Leptolyngbyaceae cyanobacterium bins.59]|nr:hypothetical protein [Leptolyngbyaceae cyanobacterium bins.59]